MSAVLAINSTTINRVTTRTTLLTCRPYAKDGFPTLDIRRAIGPLTSGPDPWDAQPVTLTQDGTLIFAGDTGTHLTHYDARLGWVREWTCYGLAKRAEYIPVTDSLTLTDTIRYNLSSDDPDYLPSRAGRTVGQIAVDVLEMPAIKTAPVSGGSRQLQQLGQWGHGHLHDLQRREYRARSPSRPGARATPPHRPCSCRAAAAPGRRRRLPSPPAPSRAITLTAGGSGYTSAPIVVLSTLPSVTLTDLDALAIIPPFEADVAGERILQSLEGMVQSCHPNHFVQVDPQGNIRFLDPRTFAGSSTITLEMDGSDPRVGRPSITADWSGCYTACEVRGSSLVVPVTVQTEPWQGSTATDGGLVEDFAHDGLTNSQAKAAWTVTDFTSPQISQGTATGNPTVAGGAITSIAVGLGGYNYASAPSVLITDSTGSGAELHHHDFRWHRHGVQQDFRRLKLLQYSHHHRGGASGRPVGYRHLHDGLDDQRDGDQRQRRRQLAGGLLGPGERGSRWRDRALVGYHHRHRAAVHRLDHRKYRAHGRRHQHAHAGDRSPGDHLHELPDLRHGGRGIAGVEAVQAFEHHDRARSWPITSRTRWPTLIPTATRPPSRARPARR